MTENPIPDPDPAGLARRLMALLYDSFLVVALMFLAAAAALPIGGEQQAFRDVPYTIYLVSVWFLYLGFFWTHSGHTLGMRAWKIRLQPLAGETVTWQAAAIRFLVGVISFGLLGAGFWLSLFRADRACWHDLASKTRLEKI